ncbi:MAG: ATP-dependent DNA helicase RecG [Deltaproteobacteria bacterium]|nr:ATP-dependent DNA helicase RecG [Deltaproteobacteria bacterium]MBM4322052.1 ATP-dependent DNA helicase RecG [Deltaproteobacteria bacterium]MBM4346497.1 ATP-dependent DNA helicase RecG [Deltaproteobacteria bacterium]
MNRQQPKHFKNRLQTPVQYVKGVGPKLAKLLEKKGLRTVEDGLYFLPRAYEDRRQLKKISELRSGKKETGFGEIMLSGMAFFQGRKKKVFEVLVGDGSGMITLKWFHGNERYLLERFKKGRRLIFSGEVRWFNYQKEIHHPDVEIVEGDIEEDYLNFKRIVPIYSETEGLYQRTLRRLVKNIIDGYADELSSPIPAEIVERQDLINFSEAFRRVHFPPDGESIEKLNLQRSDGHRRIIFDEFFFLELGLALKKRGIALEAGISFKTEGILSHRLLERLSFQLTAAQMRTLSEIIEDMEKPHPMNRLIQGDVGSGKTIVALLASLQVVECGYQAAIMAPTEVLAEQHYLTIHRWVEPLGVRVALLTSNIKGSEREEIYGRIRSGEVQIVIGTHAVIQEQVEFHRLGLAIIDEQHKFGVVQRGLLKKKGENPDVLVMTATPIPRTLAMTLYGDLDISLIDEMPPGRMPIETKVFPESARSRVYRIVEEEVRKGRQVFIVYPLVEESEKLDLKDATQMAEHLQKEVFPEFRIGLLHGRMKSEEKEAIMMEFKERKIEILVATTVIEVGIDIPNASVMVVEHAERFGLSQLHQLRGRIGRGQYRSKCILLAQYRSSEEARIRLRAMEQSNDGFKIAEQDLELRGPGDFFGIRQSGLPDFRVAHILRDTPILIEARKEAFELVQEDPELKKPANSALKEVLKKRWRGRLEMAAIG